MGWLYTNKPKGESVKDFFSKQFTFETDRYSSKLLECAVVKMRTAYMAIEQVLKVDGARTVFAVVCFLHYAPKDYNNFGYKDMDETMGPYAYDCPEKILKLLTPTDNEYARNWREKCWLKINDKKSRPKVKVGDVIKFDTPIQFTNGDLLDTFQVIDLKRNIFSCNYRNFRISKWREKKYSVIHSATAV